MDIETPALNAHAAHPSDEGYAAASRLALAGELEAAQARSGDLPGADGLRLLDRVLVGRHRDHVPLGPLPRILDLDRDAQFDLAHRLVAVAHIERERFLADHDLVVTTLLRRLLPHDYGDPDRDTLERHTLEGLGHLATGSEARPLMIWTAERLALPSQTAERAVVYLLAHGQSPAAVREGVEAVRLAPALSHLNLAADIVDRLTLTDLARHLDQAFSYPPDLGAPDLDDLPVHERYDLLFQPHLFDSEVRASKDQELWLMLHADGFLDDPVIRARRAEFMIWAEDDDEALGLVDGVEHPLARAMYVKALVNIVRDGGGYPESLYRDARAIADEFREYASSKDLLEREAMMHMLEMLGAVAYYYDGDPETAAFYATRALHVADELGMLDKMRVLQSQVAATFKTSEQVESEDQHEIADSPDPRRQELHAIVRLRAALRQRNNGRALEIAEGYFGATHIPLLVKALCRYSELDYWGVGALLHEADSFRPDIHVFKSLLTLQTFVRVGEVSYANPARALDDLAVHLANISAPFEVLADARSIFPLGLLLAAAFNGARGDVRREAEHVPIMRMVSEGRSGTWHKGDQVAVVPPGVLKDIFAGEAHGDRPIEYFTQLSENRNPFSNKDDLRRTKDRHERAGLDWRTCVPEITLYMSLIRLDKQLPGHGFGVRATQIADASPEVLKFLQ